MTLPRLIGITGFARAGKDTVGLLLGQYGYRRVALADPIKEMASAIGWHGEKEDLLPCSFCGMERGRRLLQRLGTEGGRKTLGDDVWINHLLDSLVKLGLYTPGAARWAVTDVRYPNEASKIRRAGGRIWKVVRPGYGPSAHLSETFQNDITPDLIIPNTGTLRDLGRLVAEVVGAYSGLLIPEPGGESAAPDVRNAVGPDSP